MKRRRDGGEDRGNEDREKREDEQREDRDREKRDKRDNLKRRRSINTCLCLLFSFLKALRFS